VISKDKRLLILGCGGHAKVAADIASAMGIDKMIFKDNDFEKKYFLGSKVIHEQIFDFKEYFFVALGDNFLREKITKDFKKNNPEAIAVTLIHPSSFISQRSSIGIGTIIMPMCVVNSNTKIGKGVIINTSSSVDHDCNLLDFSSIAPNSSLGGNVKLGYRSVISISASVAHNIKIGDNALIGGASLIINDVPDNSITYGIPGKHIKWREIGEKYL
tara:strand:+ start:1740 stop:2387 length:648 start_codon:yes stop_codon:yes gene_type:complete